MRLECTKCKKKRVIVIGRCRTVVLMEANQIKNKNLNPALGDRHLTDAESADLIAFLGALDCPGKLEEPK